MVIAVPVIVKMAVRSGPVFGSTENWTTPSPEPDLPELTVRNPALLTAVHEQLEVVLTEIDADPPELGNVVVVTPVMMMHPLGGFVPPGALGLSLHATAASRMIPQTVTRIRGRDRNC